MDASEASNKIIYLLGAVYVSYVFGKYMKGVEELPIVLVVLLIMIAARNQKKVCKTHREDVNKEETKKINNKRQRL